MLRALVMVPFVGACLAGAAAGRGGAAQYHTGQVTYRQREAELTLALVPGSTFDVDTTLHSRGATLTFAPGGKAGATPTFFLRFWISGGRTVIGALEVRGGEGGNAYFDETASKCTLTVSRLRAQDVEGSGSCAGPFEGGGAAVI
ncbi:MAG: hypothetical protein ACHQ2E_00110, partial [Gemmatimonadales bacterium]